MSSRVVYDVVIVGLGPVGAVAAHLLGLDGQSVLCIEAEAAVYPLPRAVHLDAHAVRILQHLGLLSRLLSPPSSSAPPVMTAMSHCSFLDPAYQPLLRFPSLVSFLHGLHSSYLFSQPELERALRASLSLLPSVHVLLSCRVQGLEEDEKAGVCIVSTSRGSFTSRYVLGCDGAKSTVRRLLGLRMLTLGWDDQQQAGQQAGEDRGSDWLVVDGLMPTAVKAACGLSEEGVFQVCDGRRAVTLVSMRGEELRVEARLSLHAAFCSAERCELECRSLAAVLLHRSGGVERRCTAAARLLGLETQGHSLCILVTCRLRVGRLRQRIVSVSVVPAACIIPAVVLHRPALLHVSRAVAHGLCILLPVSARASAGRRRSPLPSVPGPGPVPRHPRRCLSLLPHCAQRRPA